MKKQWLLAFILSFEVASTLLAYNEALPRVEDLFPELESFTRIESSSRPYVRHHPSLPNIRVAPPATDIQKAIPEALSPTYSNNWSGYAAATDLDNPATGSVTNVSGIWIVPALFPTLDESFSSIWVGIDGFSNGTVEQIGTEHIWANGQQYNYAWYEMYPNPPQELVGFPVNVNDVIQAAVMYSDNDLFELIYVNATQSKYTTVSVKVPGTLRSSAEWIVEAPWSNGILPLGHFSSIVWAHCHTTINGVNDAINGSLRQSTAINMVTTAGATKSYPTALIPSGPGVNSFNVIWQHE